MAESSNMVGVGLRSVHYQDVLETLPDLAFLEVHPENYFCGGLHMERLEQAAQHYPLSLHGVGLSLGSSQPLDKNHLKNLKKLVDKFNPMLVSDHASWSASGNAHLGDLLPLPYTDESLDIVVDHVKEVQDYLGRQMLVENPSSYMSFNNSTMKEAEFMASLSHKADCKLILDVNNIYVQATNHGDDIDAYLATIEADMIGEYHVAGHIEEEFEGETILIDTHSRQVTDNVWGIYKKALQIFGEKPTLIEWDKDLPAFDVLLGEAKKAESLIASIAMESRKVS